MRITLFLCSLILICALFTLQPPDFDDFNFYMHAHRDGILPTAWDFYLHWVSRPVGWLWVAAFSFNPLSLIRPGVLCSAILLTTWGWGLGRQFHPWFRAAFCLLFAIGFPFVGHAGVVNSGACLYSTGTVFGLWALRLLNQSENLEHECNRWHGPALGSAIFLAGMTIEIWLFIFAGILSVMVAERIFRRCRPSAPLIWAASFQALALVLFLLGGNSNRIHTEGAGRLIDSSFQSWLSAVSFGLRQAANTGIDFLPLLLLAAGLRSPFDLPNANRLTSRLVLPMTGGALFILLFWTLVHHFHLDNQWRVRFIVCAFGFWALWNSPFSAWFEERLPPNRLALAKKSALIFALLLLLHNGLRTFAFSNVSVMKWLAWRQDTFMAYRTDAHVRPPDWGKDDNRYRVYYNPTQFDSSEAIVYALRNYVRPRDHP